MAEPHYNYSYTPVELNTNNVVEHREKNLFTEEYYSSTDTKIYFDDDEQTEIGYISYEVQEQLKPVYGYNSRTFDDVVIGNRIVIGSFTVPIKNKEEQLFEKNKKTGLTNVNQSLIEKYNQKEEKILDMTEWFGTTNKVKNNQYFEDVDIEYANKLIALGYLDSNSLTQLTYEKAISKFQGDHSKTRTGSLNKITKDAIDKDFSKLKANSINVDTIGHMRQDLSDTGKKITGDVMILKEFYKNDQKIYYIIDNKGKRYYISGEDD